MQRGSLRSITAGLTLFGGLALASLASAHNQQTTGDTGGGVIEVHANVGSNVTVAQVAFVGVQSSHFALFTDHGSPASTSGYFYTRHGGNTLSSVPYGLSTLPSGGSDEESYTSSNHTVGPLFQGQTNKEGETRNDGGYATIIDTHTITVTP